MKNNKTSEVHITRDVKQIKSGNKEISQGDNLEIDDDAEDQIDENEKHKIVFEPEEENGMDMPLFEEINPDREMSTPRLTREVMNLRSYNNPGRLETEEVHFCFNIEETNDKEDERGACVQS